MKLIVMAIMLAGGTAQAQMSPEKAQLQQELREKSTSVGSMISSLAMHSEKDDIDALRKKLALVKNLQKDFSEEGQLRMELFQELMKLQMGMRYILDTSQADEKTLKEKIKLLSQVEASLAKNIDKKAYRIMKERSKSGRIKGNLSSLRSAIQVYYGDNEGVFPENLSVLAEKSKYIHSIPFITPPGHTKASNKVKYVSGVKDVKDIANYVDDAGGWLYVNDPGSPMHGTIVINCNHRDVAPRKAFMYSY